jgi:OOP family OmpA-OmpF porin
MREVPGSIPGDGSRPPGLNKTLEEVLMRKLFAAATSVLALALVLGGCSKLRVQPMEISPSVVQPSDINYSDFDINRPNIYVILDASSSMDEKFNDKQTKFMIAKIVTDRVNQALPGGMKFSVLRTYGHSFRQSWKATERIYMAEVHDKTEFSLALEGVKFAGGPSPLPEALKAVEKDLDGVVGNVAVLLVSDGVQLDKGLNEVTSIKMKYGDQVCFFPVFINGGLKYNAVRGQSFMEHVARLGQCGFTVHADRMNLDEFVKVVFLAKIPDTDMDGVHDRKDECEATPVLAPVSQKGCWVLDHILFDFDKYEIQEEYEEVLKEVASVMLANPDVTLVIDGHTDNVGTHHYNYQLSLMRSEEAKQRLVDLGVEPDRIDAKGFSFMCPADTNETEEGRANNRRIEMEPSRR